MLRLALPALAEEMLVLMVTWTDWWLTGHFFQADGDATKAAMSLMGYVMWLVPSMFAAVSIGATALIARWVGSGQPGLALKTCNQAFLVGALFSGTMFVLALLFGPQFIELMQLQDEAAEFANRYFAVVMWCIPLVMFSQVGASCLRGAGDTVTGFVTKLIVVFTNIVLSFSLVTGWGPMPELGWEGLAIGTAVGHGLGGLIILAVLIRGRAGLKLTLPNLMPDFSIIRRILKIGIPGGLDVATLLFSQLIFLALINALGTGAAAAHGLAVQIEAACFLPGAAFQVAATTMAGQFLGAKLPQRATYSTLWSLAIGGAIMCSAGLVLFFFGQYFAYFFTGSWNDPTTIKAAELLKVISCVMPFLATVMILTGALRGAGDTIWPLLFTAIGFFLIRIPLAAYLSFETMPFAENISGLGWGVLGAWVAMSSDVAIRSMMVVARFWNGGWKKIQV